MTYGVYRPSDFTTYEAGGRSQTPLIQAFFCAAALTVSAVAGGWFLYAGLPADEPVALEPVAILPVPPPAVLPKPVQQAAQAAAMPLDPSFTAPAFTGGVAPMTFAKTALLREGFQPLAHPIAPPKPVAIAALPAPQTQVDAPAPAPAASAPASVAQAALPTPVVPPPAVVAALPVPPPRPAIAAAASESPVAPPLSGRRRFAQQMTTTVATAPQPDRRSFFDKLFNRPQQSDRQQTALAYAAPEDGNGGAIGAIRAATPDGLTAVYNIAQHVVVLPDGTRLEAHSGLGSRLDDPRSVTEHMRGATPPATYELTPREALFHGVRALRLTPVDGTTYGRGGLLAHTYMLGPRGDSNGCVVFKNYNAFRQAFDQGRVRRLLVVAGR